MTIYRSRHKDSTSRFGGVFEETSQERVQLFAPILFSEDFLGADVAIPAAGAAESGVAFVKKIVGAAPPTLGIMADELNGILQAALTADDQKQNAEAYFNDELQFSPLQGLVFETRFRLTTLPTGNAEAVLGLISAWADGLDACTYSLFVTCDGSGLITCEKDDNATDESATSGVTLVASQWAIVRIDCTDYADIKFYVNGNRVASSTVFDWAASAANSHLQPVVGMYKASGTGEGVLEVDYVKVWQERA